MKTLPTYTTPPDTRCPLCDEPCEIVGLDNAFDYPGTHCTYGRAGTHYPAGWGWPVSDCCEADIEDAQADDRCSHEPPSKRRHRQHPLSGKGLEKMNAREVAIYSEDFEFIWSGPISEFAANNDMDANELLAELVALQETEGQTPEPLTIGGGAAPEFNLSLVDEAQS